MNGLSQKPTTLKILQPALLGALILMLPDLANAYIGPGAGLSAIGSLFALLFAVLVSILGFFWYPIKRLIKGRQGAVLEEDTSDAVETREANEESKAK